MGKGVGVGGANSIGRSFKELAMILMSMALIQPSMVPDELFFAIGASLRLGKSDRFTVTCTQELSEMTPIKITCTFKASKPIAS